MATIEDLRGKIAAIGGELRQAVDISIELRAQSPQSKDEVVEVWEEFLGGFFGYIKQRSRESKDNLLGGISWTNVKLF